MKKILLTFAIICSFGSAVAKNNNESISNNNNKFLSKKTPTTLAFILKADVPQTQSNYQCEQDCWDTKTSCVLSGQDRTYCFQEFIQCIDTCEGAGGLYQ